MADKALRVIAVSYLDVEKMPRELEDKVVEQNLIFVRINRNDRSTKGRGKKSNNNLQKCRDKNSNDNRRPYTNSKSNCKRTSEY